HEKAPMIGGPSGRRRRHPDRAPRRRRPEIEGPPGAGPASTGCQEEEKKKRRRNTPSASFVKLLRRSRYARGVAVPSSPTPRRLLRAWEYTRPTSPEPSRRSEAGSGTEATAGAKQVVARQVKLLALIMAKVPPVKLVALVWISRIAVDVPGATAGKKLKPTTLPLRLRSAVKGIRLVVGTWYPASTKNPA